MFFPVSSLRFIMRSPDFNYFDSFIKELDSKTDRVVALLGTALLDQQLLDLLQNHTDARHRFGHLLKDTPITSGQFMSRIQACHELGMLNTQEAEEMGVIHQICMEFACQPHGLSFQHEQAGELCAQLHERMPDAQQKKGASRTGRARFIDAITFLSLALWYRPQLQEQPRSLLGSLFGPRHAPYKTHIKRARTASYVAQ
jgi:hypothetical protein